jgi:replicative DNA helicase
MDDNYEEIKDNHACRTQEMGLLGAVLRRPALYANLRDVVTAAAFDWHCYGWVWSAFEKLHEQELRIDVITTGDELERENKLDEFTLDGSSGVTFSGRAALSKLREMGEPDSAESYAHKVLDYSAKRQQLEIFQKGASWAMNGRSADDIKNDIAQKLELIPTPNGQTDRHTQTIGQAVSDAYKRLELATAGEIACVSTGLVDLDKLLGDGMYAPDLLLIAGRPGQGKSAFLGTIAKNAAEKGKRIVHFGLEMANRQTAERLIAQLSGISTDRQRSGKLQDDEWALYTHAIEELAALPITLNDMPAISPLRMRQVLRRLPSFDLVIVDYIQLQSSDEKHKNRYQDVDYIAYQLKAIAKEFDVPVLAAAQLSRAVEQRQNKRPVLSDLRESGGLEQASDVVMFIYRGDQYDEKSTKQNIAEIIVAKHRNGAIGSLELVYRPTLTKFENAVTKKIQFNDWETRKDIA